MCVCICAHMRLEARVFLSHFPSSILRQGLSLNLELEDWLVQRVPGTCLSTPAPISIQTLWNPAFCGDPEDLKSSCSHDKYFGD